MASGKVRVGIVGVGAIGQGHVQAFGQVANAEVVAICDQAKEWVEHCKAQWGTKWAFDKWEDLVACDGVDAVSVCLPTIFHHTVTVAALKAGKHVLCEKPMAVSADAARQMADAARSSGKTLMISYNQRFGSDVRFLKQYIDAGNLGEVYFARTAWRRPMGMFPGPGASRGDGTTYSRNWFNEKAMGGGVGTDLGSHIVDLAMWFMGFPKLKKVCGVAYTRFLPEVLKGQGVTGDADDHTVGFAKFENGASLQIEASFGSYIECEKIVQAIYGDKGGAHRESGQPVKLFGSVPGGYTTVVPRIDIPSTTPMAHFVECLIEGKTPIVTPEQGVAVSEILDGIYRSSEE